VEADRRFRGIASIIIAINSQKAVIFIFAAVRTLNLTFVRYVFLIAKHVNDGLLGFDAEVLYVVKQR
jgi:hypothetical protein